MKTVSKKLISLLLVAIMLVAAMPVFAFADDDGGADSGVAVQAAKDYTFKVVLDNGTTVTGSNTVSIEDDQVDKTKSDYGTLIKAMKAAGLDAYTNSDAENGYTITKIEVTGQEFVVSAKANKVVTPVAEYTVTVNGDAAANGTKKLETIDPKAESDYGVLTQVMNEAGLGAYLDASKWTITKVALNDKNLLVTVEKVVPATTEHVHDYKWDGKVGDANGHTLKCDVAGCTETTKTEAHKFDSNGKCTVCGYQKAVTPATPTYTVIVKVEGKKDQTFTKVAYDGTLKADNAQAILNKAGCTDQVSDYNNLSFTNDNGTITIALSGKKNVSNPDKVTVTVVNGSETKTYELEVGKYYYDYDFFTFANQDGRKFAALKITDTAGYERILDKDVKNDSAKVRSNDAKVTVQWNADTRKIEFMTDSTLSKVGTTRDVYYGARLDSVGGTLPTTVGGKTVEYWTVWGSRIYDNTEYKWNADKVQAVPHFAGESGKVYLEIYANGNRTSKYTQIDITYLLQDGVIYRDRLTSAIESAVKTKNVKITGLFEEGDWSAYVRNVNNVTSKTSVQIGTNNADARYLYVMVNGVSTKTGDSTNPKTGDTAKLGVAAAVLAVAVVGFGAVTVINKKKGVQ